MNLLQTGRLIALGSAIVLATGTATLADTSADLQRTRAAKLALAADPELVGLNLGVTIVGNDVRIWGQIPNAATADRAKECVRKATGVTTVRDETHLPAPNQYTGPSVPPITLPTDEEGSLSVPRPTPIPSVGPVPVMPAPAPEVGPAPGEARLPENVTGTTVSKNPKAPLGTPTSGPGLSAVVPQAEPIGVLAERVRRKEPRWSGLAVMSDDGVLKLTGTARAADMWDLSDELRSLPGVRTVDVSAVRFGR